MANNTDCCEFQNRATRYVFAVILGLGIACGNGEIGRYHPEVMAHSEHFELTAYYFTSGGAISLLPTYQVLVIGDREFEFECGVAYIEDVAMEAGSGRTMLLIKGEYGTYVSQLCPSGRQVFVCDVLEASGRPWKRLQFTTDQQHAQLTVTVRYGLSNIDPNVRSVSKHVFLAQNLEECGF